MALLLLYRNSLKRHLGLSLLEQSLSRHLLSKTHRFSSLTTNDKGEPQSEVSMSLGSPELSSMVLVPNEPKDLSQERVDLISGAPEGMTNRWVYIYQPSRNAMQSGNRNTKTWRLSFDIQAKWENPLMGWTSSADSVQGLELSFDSESAATAFAKRQGWNVRVDACQMPKFQKKVYAENFMYSPGPHRLIRTK